MTQKGNNGGPAFPSPQFAVPEDLDRQTIMRLRNLQGMTLRQYYKAAALKALLSNPDYFNFPNDSRPYWLVVARDAASAADAMLAEDVEHETRNSGED